MRIIGSKHVGEMELQNHYFLIFEVVSFDFLYKKQNTRPEIFILIMISCGQLAKNIIFTYYT